MDTPNDQKHKGYDPAVGFFEGEFCHLVLMDDEYPDPEPGEETALDDDPWFIDPPAYTLEDADYFGAIWASPY